MEDTKTNKISVDLFSFFLNSDSCLLSRHCWILTSASLFPLKYFLVTILQQSNKYVFDEIHARYIFTNLWQKCDENVGDIKKSLARYHFFITILSLFVNFKTSFIWNKNCSLVGYYIFTKMWWKCDNKFDTHFLAHSIWKFPPPKINSEGSVLVTVMWSVLV